VSGDALLGVLHVGSLTQRRFSQADSDLLAHVASRVTGAVQARQLEVERAAARVVQRSLLPTRLPELPGIDFAARYVPAEIGGVGGDWHDAFALPDGRLWVMVGDIVGHGLRAALVMGRLRSTLQLYALDDHSPEEVLAQADLKLQLFEPGETATVLCAILDPPTTLYDCPSPAIHPRSWPRPTLQPPSSRSSQDRRSASTPTSPGPRSRCRSPRAPFWSPTPTGLSNAAASPSTTGWPCSAEPHTPPDPETLGSGTIAERLGGDCPSTRSLRAGSM
jgi:Stage II sporulation protein E (SpoIIE)